MTEFEYFPGSFARRFGGSRMVNLVFEQIPEVLPGGLVDLHVPEVTVVLGGDVEGPAVLLTLQSVLQSRCNLALHRERAICSFRDRVV